MEAQVVYDISHGATNDVKLCIRHTGFWNHELLVRAAAQCPLGPYGSGTRAIQLSEAVSEYLREHSFDGCPLFQSLLPSLLDDKGQSHRFHEEEEGIDSIQMGCVSKLDVITIL